MAQEADTQKTIMTYLQYRKVFAWRQNSGAMPIGEGRSRRFVTFGAVGAPDIFVIKNGAIYGLEVKSAIGRQNDNQKAFQKGFEGAGGKYYIVRSLDDVLRLQIF